MALCWTHIDMGAPEAKRVYYAIQYMCITLYMHTA